MASGVKVDDECVNMFESMKTRKTHYGIVFRISDDLKYIVVDKQFENPTHDESDTTIEEYKKFTDYILSWDAKGEGRYGVYDVRFTTSEGVRRNKLCFITFCGEGAKIKQRMLYSSSKDEMKSKLLGILNVQANDASDFTLETIVAKAQANTTYG